MKESNENLEQARLIDILIQIVEPNKDTEIIIKNEIKNCGIDGFLNNLDRIDLPIYTLGKIKSLNTIIRNLNNRGGNDIE